MPITPSDFVVITKRVGGVARVMALDGYNPADQTYNNERMIAVAAIDENGAGVSSGVKTEIDTLLQSYREVNFIVHVIDPTSTTINVTFTAKAYAGFDVATVEANAGAAVAFFLNPANWGLPPAGEPDEWINQPVVRMQDLYTVLDQVPGLDYVSALTINAGTSDVNLAGAAPLPGCRHHRRDGYGVMSHATAIDFHRALEPWIGPHEQPVNTIGSKFIHALAAMFDQVEHYSRDTDEHAGWTVITDVTRAPAEALPWLGQMAGVRVPTGTSATDARNLITTASGRKRGTPQAILDAAKRHLTGTKHVFMRERANGSAYQLVVITRTSETPDPAAVEAAIREQKPAGIKLLYSHVAGQTWDEAVATWNTVGGTTWDQTTNTNV